MTTVTLRIAVDKSGASESIRGVKDDLRGMGEEGQRSGQQAAQGVGALNSAFSAARSAVASFLAVYAGIQALSGVVRLADEYQGLTDRLRLATGSSSEFAAAQAGVFAVAQQTGTALSAVGGLYVSLANSTRELGLSQGELQTITQAVSQSFIVSGASAAQTDAAIRQLGQGFASGVLRGDEFNSMMENAPSLAAALAASLGVTTGQLRAMAAEGALTSDVLATGLLNQAPQIAAQFNAMGTTVGQAFTRLSNSVLQFVGEASQSTGAAAALAAVITGLADGLPAVAFGLTAVAAGYTAIALASAGANAGLLTTAGLVGVLATGFGALIVAYSAYKLGEYLVNEFTIVQAAVRSLYVGMNDLWTSIQTGALSAFLAITTAWNFAVESIGSRLADLIDAFVGFSQIELPLGLRADFAYGQADAMTALSASLRDSTSATEANNQATSALQGKIDSTRAEAEQYAAQMFDMVDAHAANKVATDQNASATKNLGIATGKTADEIREAKKAQDQAARAFEMLTTEIERQAGEAGGPLVSAYIELAQRLRAIDEWEVRLRTDQGLSRQEADMLRQARDGLAQALIRNVTALRDAIPAEQQYLAELREEVRVAGLTGAARQAAIIRMEAEAAARRLLTGATHAQIMALADEIEAQLNLRDAADAAGRAAEQWSQYWDGAIDSVAGAFGDFVANGMDDFESFGDALKNIAKQIVADLVSEFARLELINPILNNILGGTRQTGGSMLGNLFSGGGAAGGGGGMMGNFFGSGMGSSIAAAAPWIAAVVALNSSFEAQGWRTSTRDTARGGNFIGLLSGGINARLFGHQEERVRRATTTFGLGPEGVDGSVLLNTIQEGGFFRSDRRRTRVGEVSEEAEAAAQQLFDSVRQTMTNAARDLESTAPDMIDAALRTVERFDDEGKLKATEYFVDVLGETWEEATAEAAVSRINSEALIATIDAALGPAAAEASAIAERWRDDAMTLADGSAFLLMAATDIRQGVGLLGEGGTLTDVTEFVESLQQSGESLSGAYQRISIGAALLDETLQFLGVEFGGTRAEAVAFSAALVEAAGGFDAFSSLLRGALEVLFTEEERNQFLADQAQSQLNTALTGLNISGTGIESIRSQLREQLRAAMEAGNVELTNQILQAANLLGVFANAIEALGEDAVAAAASLTLGGTSLQTGPGLVSGAGTGLGTPSGTPVATQLEASQAAARALERHTGLLERIATNTDPKGAEDNGEKSARDGADAARQTASTLARIEQLIAQAVAAQVQTELKRLSGANKRGVSA